MKTNPATAKQHTACLLALTFARVCMDVLHPALEDTPLGMVSRRIRRLIDQCSETVRVGKEPSARAKRELHCAFEKIGPLIETEHLEGEARLQAWARNFWAAMALVSDARATCKTFTSDGRWYHLDHSMEVLAKSLTELCPDADVQGTEMYMNL